MISQILRTILTRYPILSMGICQASEEFFQTDQMREGSSFFPGAVPAAGGRRRRAEGGEFRLPGRTSGRAVFRISDQFVSGAGYPVVEAGLCP